MKYHIFNKDLDSVMINGDRACFQCICNNTPSFNNTKEKNLFSSLLDNCTGCMARFFVYLYRLGYDVDELKKILAKNEAGISFPCSSDRDDFYIIEKFIKCGKSKNLDIE